MTTDTLSQDTAAIRAMIDAWARALEAKNIDALVANCLPDALLFDLIPPYKTPGAKAIRATWEHCLPHFPPNVKIVTRDLKLVVGSTVAFAHYIQQIQVPGQPDHPCSQSWLRVTSCFQKVDGRWYSAHDHVSQPYNPMNGMVVPITDPDNLTFDFAACANQKPGASK